MIAKTIPVQPWMTAAAPLMRALGAGAAQPQALFVGGCVRNALLGEAVTDIDIATRLTPPEVMETCAAAGIRTVPTGIDHGTVTALLDGKPFEITTLRRDVETDGRRAVVAFSQDWAEDAQRRDFTINTLLADSDGHIYDPTGQGLGDLAAGRVVFVGDPAQRIAEDYLRILRFFRFHARYGKGAPDPAALSACEAAADKIATLSRERISQEFFKILMTADPASILSFMFENNVLRELLFAGYQEAALRRLCALQQDHDADSLAARLLILAGTAAQDNRKKMLEYLIFSNALKKEIEAIGEVMAGPSLDHDVVLKQTLYRRGRAATLQALLIQAARQVVAESAAAPAVALIKTWDIPVFPVSGEDLIRQGHTPGPELGRRLREMEEAWIARGFV